MDCQMFFYEKESFNFSYKFLSCERRSKRKDCMFFVQSRKMKSKYEKREAKKKYFDSVLLKYYFLECFWGKL